ncbi:hypothetical protein KP509_31G015400 [Ceratopteris richardii]|uniref:Cyclin n=1 Tax=Ceratopteris richardii TaxID=49495 RepID=A0A8T2QXL3_CERRI|nr:hypothetical protein KP509_31G015400 [Ceratopteris richardii]
MEFMSEISEDVSPCSIRSDLYSPEALEGRPASSKGRKCPTVIRVLSSLVERVVVRNDRLPSTDDAFAKFSIFSGVRVPVISIEQYLERIFRYANCSTSCFVVAYAYIDRLVQHQRGLLINSLNVHRILITSILVAAKFLDDSHFHNAYYAQIGGISTAEMNKLEWTFLSLIDFRLQVTVSVFESYCSHLEREVSLGGGYHIERVLQAICSLEEESQKNQEYNAMVA